MNRFSTSRAIFFAAFAAICGPLFAQSLSVEDIQARLDQQQAALDPYVELLNDPDPTRSRGAMRIMMESGDEILMGLAREYGLLSSNETVRSEAFRLLLATQPILPVSIGITDAGERSVIQVVQRWGGIVDTEGFGYIRLFVGPYVSAKDCYVDPDYEDICMFTINSNGIFLFLRLDNGRAKVEINASGELVGILTSDQFSKPVPITITLLD